MKAQVKILMFSVIFFLFSCKKEEIEPKKTNYEKVKKELKMIFKDFLALSDSTENKWIKLRLTKYPDEILFNDWVLKNISELNFQVDSGSVVIIYVDDCVSSVEGLIYTSQVDSFYFNFYTGMFNYNDPVEFPVLVR